MEHLASLQGLEPGDITPGRMTYDLRRLRLHGLVERMCGTHRYRLTELGLRTALFFTRAYARIVRDGFTRLMEGDEAAPCEPEPRRFNLTHSLHLCLPKRG